MTNEIHKEAEMNDIKYAKIPLLNLDPEITNKMKSDCMGEVKFEKEATCTACHYEEPDEDCEVCGGEVYYKESITVPWDAMKDIYKLMVKSVMKVEK